MNDRAETEAQLFVGVLFSHPVEILIFLPPCGLPPSAVRGRTFFTSSISTFLASSETEAQLFVGVLLYFFTFLRLRRRRALFFSLIRTAEEAGVSWARLGQAGLGCAGLAWTWLCNAGEGEFHPQLFVGVLFS